MLQQLMKHITLRPTKEKYLKKTTKRKLSLVEFEQIHGNRCFEYKHNLVALRIYSI